MTVAAPSSSLVSSYVLTYFNDRGPLGRLALPADRAVTIGRALESDLRLNDGLTSRRHAQVSIEDSNIVIEDLESANGTFINGQKIRRAVLQPGDRILIGITTIELLAEHHNSPKPAPKSMPASSRHDSETTIVGTARLMSGSVKEFPLADLLQLLGNTRKSGLLTVRNQRDQGQILVRDGRICGARINDHTAAQPERTLFRLLRWQTGFFELRPPGEETITDTIHQTTDSLLLEAAQHQDELLALEQQLPHYDARLVVPENFPGEISDLSQTQFDVLQLVLEHGVLLPVIDGFAGSDLDGYRAVVELLKRGFIVATE